MNIHLGNKRQLIGFIKFQLIASFAIILICTMTSSFFSYRIMEREMTKVVINNNNRFLELYSQTINSLVVSNSNEIYLKILSDAATLEPIRKYVKFPLSGNIVDTYEVHNYLKSIKDSNNHLLSVEILYSDNNLLISSDRILYDLFYAKRRTELAPYDTLLNMSAEKKGGFLYLADNDVLTITKPIVTGQRINALCIINYSLPLIKKHLDEMMPLEFSNIYIIDGGQVLFSINDRFDLPDISDYSFEEENGGYDFLVKEIDKDKYIFSYKTFGSNFLSYLSVSRSKIYTEPVGFILRNLFTAIVFTLIAGIFISFLLLRWQVKPMEYVVRLCSSFNRTRDGNTKTGNTYEFITSTINHLAYTVEKNTRELDMIMPVLRDNFIFWLINERPSEENVVLDKLRHMNVRFDYKYFALFAIKFVIGDENHLDCTKEELMAARIRMKLENFMDEQKCLYKFYNMESLILGFINTENAELNVVDIIDSLSVDCRIYFSASEIEDDLAVLSTEVEDIINRLKLSYVYPEKRDLSSPREYDINNDDILWSYLKWIAKYLKVEEFENASEEVSSFALRMGRYGCSYIFLDNLAYNAAAEVEELKNIETKYKNDLIGAFHESTDINMLNKKIQFIVERIAEHKREISWDAKTRLVTLAKEYIRENFTDEQISLQRVADVLNVTPSHLSRMFSETEEITFVEYLKHQKLELGRKLLLETSLSLDEIACRLNYSSPQYFITLFKKQFGLTPNVYRKKHI